MYLIFEAFQIIFPTVSLIFALQICSIKWCNKEWSIKLCIYNDSHIKLWISFMQVFTKCSILWCRTRDKTKDINKLLGVCSRNWKPSLKKLKLMKYYKRRNFGVLVKRTFGLVHQSYNLPIRQTPNIFWDPVLWFLILHCKTNGDLLRHFC